MLTPILPHFLTCFKIQCECGKGNYLTSWREGKGNCEGHVWREMTSPYSMSLLQGLGPICQGQTWQLPVRFIVKWQKEKVCFVESYETFLFSAVKGRKSPSKNTRSFANGLRKKEICINMRNTPKIEWTYLEMKRTC